MLLLVHIMDSLRCLWRVCRIIHPPRHSLAYIGCHLNPRSRLSGLRGHLMMDNFNNPSQATCATTSPPAVPRSNAFIWPTPPNHVIIAITYTCCGALFRMFFCVFLEASLLRDAIRVPNVLHLYTTSRITRAHRPPIADHQYNIKKLAHICFILSILANTPAERGAHVHILFSPHSFFLSS